jgi:hypothetical protein
MTLKRRSRAPSSFEVWGRDLIVQRELEAVADLAVVQEIGQGPGRTHLQAYVDQEKGRILVFSPGGKQLADLKVPDNHPVALPGLSLESRQGDVRLDWLSISRWNGDVPSDSSAGQTRILCADGTNAHGKLTGFDPASKEFHLKSDKDEIRIAVSRLSSVVVPVPADEAPRTIRAVFHDGSRVSGEPGAVQDGVLILAVSGIQEPLRLPLGGLRLLEVLRHQK